MGENPKTDPVITEALCIKGNVEPTEIDALFSMQAKLSSSDDQ
jgi:hypothetical protein